MPAILIPTGKQAFTTSAGIPLNGGKVYTYVSGTTTLKTTWADAAQTTPNANPVILSSRGEATIFWNGAYKVTLRDSADALIWTVDGIQATIPDSTLHADLALTTGAGLVGFIQPGTGPVAATVQKKLREQVDFESDFGGVGDGTTDNKAAFDLFRTYIATLAGSNPNGTATLNFAPGKTYASTDPGWMVNLGLKKFILNAKGSHFKNTLALGGGGGFLDTVPLLMGGLGYIDAVTANLTAKGLAINFANNYLINTATRGSATVTTTTAADAGNFTAGNWVLICSDLSFVGGSPPSMHFFEYAKVLTAVAGSGVITLDGTLLRNDYSATRDNTLLSGQFGSRARIFKLHSSWDCDIEINDLIVDPSTNYPTLAAYVFGRDIKTNNCRFPGVTTTNADSYVSTDDRFENATAFEPVDKLVRLAVFKNPRFAGSDIGGDGSGGLVRFEGGSSSGMVRAWKNFDADGFTFGGSASSGAGLKLGTAQRFRATNCSGPSALVSFEEAIAITVDGATITSTATTIVIPRASITTGSVAAQFYGALTKDCRIDEVSDTTGSFYTNGRFCIVTSITDVGANLVIGVNYSGGVAIANGTVFHAPRLQAYHASGNTGAGALISNTAPQSSNGIPNGGLEVARGNKYERMIAPLTGETFDFAAYPANGIPKRMWVRVHRAYTGATYAAGLGLEFLGVLPTAAQYERVSLLTTGVREATRSVATAGLGTDTWAVLPATYTGRFRLVINSAAAGAGVVLAEATQLLPMVELLIEFEDVAHDVPVAS